MLFFLEKKRKKFFSLTLRCYFLWESFHKPSRCSHIAHLTPSVAFTTVYNIWLFWLYPSMDENSMRAKIVFSLWLYLQHPHSALVHTKYLLDGWKLGFLVHAKGLLFLQLALGWHGFVSLYHIGHHLDFGLFYPSQTIAPRTKFNILEVNLLVQKRVGLLLASLYLLNFYLASIKFQIMC